MPSKKTTKKNAVPVSLTVGGRTYNILGLHKESEEYIKGKTFVARAKEIDANFGKDDVQHLLKYQKEIPAVLRGKVRFVFPDWQCPDTHGIVYCVGWNKSLSCWKEYWDSLGYFNFYLCDIEDDYRVLRRRI